MCKIKNLLVIFKVTGCLTITVLCSQTLQTNTFQAVLVTDGANSFAIFIYRCGDLQWGHEATIGYGASFEMFSNNRLSLIQDATSIACLNAPDNQFFTVVYEITNSTEGTPLAL